MHQAVQLLRELIALPSVNPAFLPPNDPRGGEQRVAEFLLSIAARAGLEVEIQEVAPNRANVLARLPPNGAIKQCVVLAPHMDTVGGDASSLFEPDLRKGRVYGRGACDTKGSIACMVTALLNVARSGTRPRHSEIMLAALVDEENAQAGSRFLARSGFKANLAIVGEPTKLRVVTAHKGDVWLRMLARGKAAHGARPDLGRNAVHLMARVVDLLESAYGDQLRRRRHPLLGPPTINVGVIAGGSQPNIVPDRCTIDVDRRTLPGESENTVRKELRALLAQHGLHTSVDFIRGGPCPALETDARLPLVEAFMRLAGQASPLGVDYFCDAAVLADGGIPSVVFGPGDIAQAHTPNEWIATRQLEAGTALLQKFLQSLP